MDTTPALPVEADRLLAFWFADALASAQAARTRSRLWFSRDPDFDATLARDFGTLPERAADGALDGWCAVPRPALARILALDQLPRNLFRGSARSFAFDTRAAAAAIAAVDAGHDRALHPLEAVFVYLPLEHAEDAALQDRSVDLFEALRARAPAGLEALFESYADFARRHREVIRRFGRFPHRNAVLGRESTGEEEAYLAGGGERFGGGSGAG